MDRHLHMARPKYKVQTINIFAPNKKLFRCILLLRLFFSTRCLHKLFTISAHILSFLEIALPAIYYMVSLKHDYPYETMCFCMIKQQNRYLIAQMVRKHQLLDDLHLWRGTEETCIT